MRMFGRRGWRTGFVAAVLTLAAGVIQAQSTTGVDPTQIMQSLSSDQQQAILQRLSGVGSSSMGTTGLGSGLGSLGSSIGGLGTGQSGSFGDLSNANNPNSPLYQRKQREAEADDIEEAQRRLKGLPVIFRPEDTVIVEVDLHPLAAAVQTTASASLTQQQLQQLQSAPANVQAAAQAALAQQSAQPQSGAQGSAPEPGADPQLSPDDRQRLQALIELIKMRDPYQLDANGVLNLPGFTGIALAGLTEAQAALRLEVEPALSGLHFRLTRLPLRRSGLAGLKPFGYDLFNEYPSTFAPVTNVPVPSDYVVGAGDVLQVQLYGSQNRFLQLTVDRDGRVNFPELGPVSVVGQRFQSVKEELEARIARQMIGVKGSVSMSETRAIQVFVLGEAQTPGSYTVSGLGTITSALYAAGGIKQVGSLRDIQLKRGGQLIRRLDLYDLLMRGDNSGDIKLMAGDVVFIPPRGDTASVEGEVQRPAIYELRPGTNVTELAQLAGGLTPKADASAAMLSSIDQRGGQNVVAVNLSVGQARGQSVRNGDVLRVPTVRATLDAGVQVQGYVYAPGQVAYHPGLRLTDVLRSVDDLKPNADLHYVLIRREDPPNRHIRAFSADLAAALLHPGSAADVVLQARDQVTVFDLQSGRDRVIQPLMDDLKLEASSAEPEQVVHVDGRVRVPGEYPLERDMTVADLIRAGGSLRDSAYNGRAELARYEIVDGEERKAQVIEIDLAAALKGDPAANLTLRPFDSLSVSEISLWGQQEKVVLGGQVRFPGTYSIKHGETLKSVIARAGGLTEFAFPEGSVFTRVELQKREQEQLDFLGQRMQTDIATMALQAAAGSALNGNGGGGSNAQAALNIGQSLLSQLRDTRAVGRLVLDLPKLMAGPAGSEYDVSLRNGDQLLVPRFQQEVTVIGEVQSVTSHLFRTGLTREDYINQSGGMTRHADAKKIYVVRANGSVVANVGGGFFRIGDHGVKIMPGDTIVVPLDTEHLPPLPMWEAITQIIYNTAVAVAAVHSLSL